MTRAATETSTGRASRENVSRHFCEYVPPRSLDRIEADIKALEADIVRVLGGVTHGVS